MKMRTKDDKDTTLPTADRRGKRKRLMRVLNTVIVVCFCLAWAAPLRNIITRRIWSAPDAGERDAYEFIAIAYTQAPRSSTATNGPYKAAIHAHLDALTANGFVPVTLVDITNLLRRGMPLPRKAVLLTVDADSQTFLHDMRSAVWRYGWRGVAFFNTASLSRNAADKPNWSTVRKMDRSGHWETGLSGHLATEAIPASTRYSGGQFLTARMWLAAPQRLETEAEFRTRIEQDYQTAVTLAKAERSRETRAFAFPSGDFGQFSAPESKALEINLQAVAAHFDVAFTLGPVGRNTMFSDPHRLNRMEVNPNWTASDLLDAVRTASRPVALVEDTDMTRKATGWFIERGRFEISADGLTLESEGETKDGMIWLGGSNVRRDFSATIDFRLMDGNAAFYLRAATDRSTYLRIEFDENGNAFLQQKTLFQQQPITLARTRTPIRKGRKYQLTIYMRDSNINVSVDGLTVFNTHEQASGLKQAGYFGAAVRANETPDAKTSMIISSLTLTRRRSTLASWTFDKRFDPHAINWIQNNGSRLTEISPPVQRLHDNSQGLATEQQTHIYRRLASLYNLRLVPCLAISSDTELAAWTPVSLAGTLTDLDCDGLYVNFEHYDKFQINELENWLRQTSKMLSGAGRPVLVRLPRMLERLSAVYSLLAMIPSVEIVTDANTQVGLDAAQAKQIHEEVIAPPTPEELNALPPVYTIEPNATENRQVSIDVRIRALVDEGESAFGRGMYDSAIAAFAEWNRLAPGSPVPPRRIGDALSNLGYHDEAISFYRQSLDIAPAQIDLAARYARLLGDTGRQTEARHLLNTYARLFPDNAEILLAQAEWLYRANRIEEANQRAQRVLLLNPDHFEATLFRLRTADSEMARKEAIQKLMAASKTAEQQYKLISAIRQHDLLSYQDSHLFIKVMDQIASANPDPRTLELIRGIDPLERIVTEHFAATAMLSRNWQVEGGEATVRDGLLTVASEPSRNEFSVRLLRSERWRDSFIAVEATEIRGGLWLYGRRSRDHLIRFGFDQDADRLNLQIWKGRNNDVVASQFVPWTFPVDGCRLRLEIRGKGVTGLVDGNPVFEVPLALPDDFGLGYTAFASHSTERGFARATIRNLASGPLPVRTALAPDAPAVDDRGEQTARMRSLLPVLTDISPDWFSVDDSGSWNSNVKEESDFFKLFARYYRLRLTPVARISPDALIHANDIITVCRTHGFDGMVLWFENLPDEAWFDRMDRELSIPGLDVIAVGNHHNTPTIRGIAASRSLFRKDGRPVPLVLIDAIQQEEQPKRQDTLDPVMFRF